MTYYWWNSHWSNIRKPYKHKYMKLPSKPLMHKAQPKKELEMQQSQDSIKDLALALAKAQYAIEGAKKDSTNPHFKNKYADLSSVWDACRKQLTENGLSVVQVTEGGPETVTVTTRLIHISGQWLEGSLTMRPQQMTPQGLGSCITYCRRYALAAMVGVCPEDDDGQAASSGSSYQTRKPEPVEATGPSQDPNANIASVIGVKRKIRSIVDTHKLSWPQVTQITGVTTVLQNENMETLLSVLDKLEIHVKEVLGA